MKKRLFCVLLAAFTVLLTACGGKGGYAIKVGDQIVSENDYYRNVLLLRTNYLSSLNEEDTKELWTEPMDDGATMSQVFVDYIDRHLTETKLYACQFERLGLSFSEEEEATIARVLSETVESSGGMTAFNQALAEQHYTYEEYLAEVYDSAKKSKVLSYYYNEKTGQRPVKVQDLKDYYNVHNARVKSVILLKTDRSSGNPLQGDALRAQKEKAERALEAAQANAGSETDLFEEVISVYSDDKSTIGNGVVLSDSDEIDETLLNAALGLENGEVCMTETENAFYILKRYDGTADAYFTATVQQAVLETVRADEISAMLEEWRGETEIKINRKITNKYLPEKLLGEYLLT